MRWVAHVETLCRSLRSTISRPFLDQLTRAALSIPLNIAEGNGRWHKKEKRQFLWIARGSVFECVPIIQILREKEVVSEEEYSKLYIALERMSKMLSGLIKSVGELEG